MIPIRTPLKRPMDVEYILRSSMAAPILPCLIIVAVGTSDIYTQAPLATVLTLIPPFAIMALRMLTGLGHLLLGRIPTEKAVTWSLNLSYLSALSWCCFAGLALNQYGIAWPGYLILLTSTAVVCITPTFTPLPPVTVKIYTGMFLLPIISWGCLSPLFYGQALAALSLLYFLMVTLVSGESRSWLSQLFSHMTEMEQKSPDRRRKTGFLERGFFGCLSHIRTINAKKEIYRLAFQTSPNPIAINHLYSGTFSHVNTIFSSQFGYTPEEVNGKTPLEVGLWVDASAWEAFLTVIRTKRGANNFQCQFRTRDGLTRSVLLSSRRITLAQDNFALTTLTDITEFSRAETKIKHLTRKIIQVQEEERRRIARDLHDSVAQDLSSLKIICSGLLQAPVPDSELRTKLRDISHVLHTCIGAVKNIAYELRPPILDEMGLPTALFRHCDHFQRNTGIEVDFFSAGLNGIPIDSDTEINLYRLVQEALSNVLKHAQATRVVLRLVASFPDIIMRLEDNGVGFDRALEKTLEKKSMGLHSMEERVLLMGGRLRIVSSPGEGTALIIRVPFNMSEQELEAIYKKVGSIG